MTVYAHSLPRDISSKSEIDLLDMLHNTCYFMGVASSGVIHSLKCGYPFILKVPDDKIDEFQSKVKEYGFKLDVVMSSDTYSHVFSIPQ